MSLENKIDFQSWFNQNTPSSNPVKESKSSLEAPKKYEELYKLGKV